MNADEIKAAILGSALIPKPEKLSRHELKSMVRRGEWATLGQIYGFKPDYTKVGKKVYFNWVSANGAFLNALFGEVKPDGTRKPVPIPGGERFRDESFRRQAGLCHYCNYKTPFDKWTIEHRQPKSLGGGAGANKVGACFECNNSKSNMTEADFLASEVFQQILKYKSSGIKKPFRFRKIPR